MSRNLRRTAARSAALRPIPLGGVAVVLLSLTTAPPVRGQDGPGAGQELGRVEFPVSCTAAARGEFEHAVKLLHHMTYPQARSSFEKVATLDPSCAMAHWGVAMTLFQPLWPTRPGPAELRRGRQAMEAARAQASPTERERLLIDAVAAFFGDAAPLDYWERIARWAAGMQRAHTAYPDDAEVTAFHALALLATAPAGATTTAHADSAAYLLLRVYESNPDHPGAMHYIVHATDVTGREHESPDVVDRYQLVAPSNPHALHMPTHIYTRTGDWDRVVAGNLRAAEAALQYPAGADGQYVWDEFPHAIEYLVYAYLQKGEDMAAAAQIERLDGTARLDPTFKTAYHIASAHARYALERHAWAEARALVPREPAWLDWDRYPWPEAVTWFARGLGAVHLGDLAEARVAVDHLQALDDAATATGETLFARNIRVLALGVRAWLAHAEGDAAGAIALMTEAAELEAATPKPAVTPGPTVPARELLGDLLMAQGQAAAARTPYDQALELYPHRFNSLLGGARAARASGVASRAAELYRELLAIGAGGDRRAALDEALSFLASVQHPPHP